MLQDNVEQFQNIEILQLTSSSALQMKLLPSAITSWHCCLQKMTRTVQNATCSSSRHHWHQADCPGCCIQLPYQSVVP